MSGQTQDPSGARAPRLSLTEAVDRLPEIAMTPPGDGTALGDFTESFSGASDEEVEAVLPKLAGSLGSSDSRVRGLALISYVGVLTHEQADASKLPPPDLRRSLSLVMPYLPKIAAHLDDPAPRLRAVTLMVLSMTVWEKAAREQLVPVLEQALAAPDALRSYPDEEAEQASQRTLARMPEDQRAAMERMPHSLQRIDPVAPAEVGLLLQCDPVSTQVTEAVLAFLKRGDQTEQTLGETARVISLSPRNERVDSEAARLLLQPPVLSENLLNYLPRLQLTPNDFAESRARLLAVARDEGEPAPLRAAAKKIAACWQNDPHRMCDAYPEGTVPQGPPPGRRPPAEPQVTPGAQP